MSDKLNVIHGNRDSIEIHVQFTEDEMNAMRKTLADTTIEQAIADDEFAIIRAAHNGEKKERKAKMKTLLADIRNERALRQVMCDLIPNFETGMMEFYSIETGAKVHERRLKPEEKQLRLDTGASEGTNG